MIATWVCFYLVLIALFMTFLSPPAEGCLFLLACLLNSPLCPYNLTASG
ncbi:hypothetical protein KR032_006783 [Drosophila birchii]|nr:hypothetical protein KR032_006783 [Drosophila birchii]